MNDSRSVLVAVFFFPLACAVWGKQWTGWNLVVHCDNAGAMAVVNSGYSRVDGIMHLLSCLFFIRARFQLSVRAIHTPGQGNMIADMISWNIMLA